MNLLVKLTLNTIAIILTAMMLKAGVQLQDFWYGVLLAVLLALLNISVKPVLIFLTIPATILTLGLFLLVINALMIEIAASILEPHFAVKNFWWALLFSLVLSVINSIFERLTRKAPTQDDNTMQVFDKDGNRIA